MFLFLLLLLSSIPLLGQVEPIYRSLNGGGGLQMSPGGTFLISSRNGVWHSYISCVDQSEIVGLPQAASRGAVMIITDSLILAQGRYVIDVSTRNAVDSLPHNSKSIATSVSPDRRRVAQLLDSGRVIVWRVSDRQIEYDERHFGYDTIYFSGNSEHLLVADKVNNAATVPLLLVKLSSPSWLKAFRRSDILGCLSPDADTLYTTTRSGQINVWDLRTDSLVRTSWEFYTTATGSLEVDHLAIDPSRSTLLLGGRKTAIIDLVSLTIHTSYDAKVIRISDGMTFSALLGRDGLLRIIDLKLREQVDSVQMATSTISVQDVACSGDIGIVSRLRDQSIVGYSRGIKNDIWQIDRVGAAISSVSIADDVILTSPDFTVYSVGTGTVTYRLRDVFQLDTWPTGMLYDDQTHRYWYGTNEGIGFLDPADSSELFFNVKVPYKDYGLVKRGEVFFVGHDTLAAYSTRTGQILWSGLNGHTVDYDTAVYIGSDLVVVYENPNWLIIDITSGTIIQSIEASKLPTVLDVVFTNDPSRLLLRNSTSTFVLWNVDQAVAMDTINNAHYVDRVDGQTFRIYIAGGSALFYNIRDQSRKSVPPSVMNWMPPVLSGDVLIDQDQRAYHFYEYSSDRALLSITRTNIDDPFGSIYYDDRYKLFVTENGRYGTFSVYDLTDHIVTSVHDDRGTGSTNSAISVALSPNPVQTSASIIVQFSVATQQQLQIVDLTGRVLRTFYGDGSLATQQFPLNSQDLPQGVLFVRATDSAHSHTSILAH